jgi:hypothetical protein
MYHVHNSATTDDNKSVISELTGPTTYPVSTKPNRTIESDSCDTNSENDQQLLRTNLANRTNDELKTICRENNISGVSRMNKPDIIAAIVAEYTQVDKVVRTKTLLELRALCKPLAVKGVATMNKTALISVIATHNASTMSKFIIAQELVPQQNIQNVTATAATIVVPASPTPPVIMPALQINHTDTIVTQHVKDPVVSTSSVDEEKRDGPPVASKCSTYTKQKITKGVRVHVWNTYIGQHISQHRCLCCKKTIIDNTQFEVGHVISEKDGGTLEMSNLRPICMVCNRSMGTENMIEYIKKYGYYL